MTYSLNELSPDVLKSMELASVWHPPTGNDEPVTVLLSWRVYEVDWPEGTTTVHFAGDTGREGRVCSAVLKYADRKGTTRSRVYHLKGDPGFSWSSDAAYVWNRWVDLNGNPTVREVTDRYK